jgi:hypothetical protein
MILAAPPSLDSRYGLAAATADDTDRIRQHPGRHRPAAPAGRGVRGLGHRGRYMDSADWRTTLWIEANEDDRTLDVAGPLLSWNLELFHFASRAGNPHNLGGDAHPMTPVAFQADLLADDRIVRKSFHAAGAAHP